MGRITGKLVLLLSVAMVGCQKSSEDPSVAAAVKTLYVATGVCNAGFSAAAMATYAASTASRTIERFALDTGVSKGTLMDFTSGNFLANTNPNSIIDAGEDLWVSVENATTVSERGVWRVPKADPYNFNKYISSVGAFTGAGSVVRGMAKDADGSFFLGTTSKIEKFNPTPVRVTQGANAWIQAPTGNCSPAATSMTAVANMLPLSPATSGKLIYGHQASAAASPTMQRIAVMNVNGWLGGSDCAGGVQISSVTHTFATSAVGTASTFVAGGTSPTAMVYIPLPAGSAVTGKLIVAYSNNIQSNFPAGVYQLNHAIVMWNITETSATAVTIDSPVVLYDRSDVVYAISAMTYDADTNSLYVAVSGEIGAANQSTNGVGYNIEKFTLDINAPTLTRVLNNEAPFVTGALKTRCISSLAIGE